MKGGARQGAGRKAGSGQYGEETVVMRIPKSYAEVVKETLLKFPKTLKLEPNSVTVEEIFRPLFLEQQAKALYACRVAAGAPVVATDDLESTLDLNEHLMKNPDATFFVRVNGDSMIGAGIHPDDLLVVDRALAPGSGKIVIAVVNGELTVKRLFRDKGKLLLMPENPSYPAIEITQETDFMIWGVVTNVIHSL